MSNINLGLGMSSLDVGLKQAAYTGVILHAGKSENGETKDYLAGSTSGNVLEVTVPNGTQAMAYAILDGLKKRGYQYQPFESENTVTDPAIEIGDNVTANGITSVVSGIQLGHSALMSSTLKAPFDEEVNHEWKYEPRLQRQFSRESAYTRSRLAINENSITAEVARATTEENRLSSRVELTAESITAEVARATAEEGNLSGRITVNANAISSEVARAIGAEGSLSTAISQTAEAITAKVSKTGGISSSFGWSLTDSSWTLTSNNTTVLKATSSGIEVNGKITATSGYIGNGSSGFTIGNTAIYNGMTAIDDADHNGLYLGTDGISLGKGNFTVTRSGALTAKSGYIGNGSAGFTIGNQSIRNGMTGRDDTTNNGIWIGTNGIALGAGKFKVTSAGAVTAANFAMTGGSITIKDGDGNVTFKVSNTGALTATSGTFSGKVYAGKIQHGGDYGTLSGSGITDNSITSGKYGNESIGGGKIIIGTITGGTDGNGYPIGNIASESVAYGNVGFTGTLDQVGTNTSNISSLYNYFNGTNYATTMKIANLYLLFNGDYCPIGGSIIKDGDGNYVAVLTF